MKFNYCKQTDSLYFDFAGKPSVSEIVDLSELVVNNLPMTKLCCYNPPID